MRHLTAVALLLVFTQAFVGAGNKPAKAHATTSKGKTTMHLYLDVHNKVDGLTAEAVAGAHKKDLEVGKKYGVHYLRYWFDEGSGKVFCLVQAPSAEAAMEVHKEAHGLVADQITEVKEGK